jgi:hypothetical protein
MKIIVEFPNLDDGIHIDTAAVRAEDADWVAMGCKPESEDFEVEKIAVMLTGLEAGISKLLAESAENIHHVERLLGGVSEKIHSLTASLYASRVGSEALLADLLGSALTRRGQGPRVPRVSVIPLGSVGSPEELKRVLEKLVNCKDCKEDECPNSGGGTGTPTDKCKLN